MKKIDIGNYTVYSEIDVDIDINKPIKLKRTLQDFGNDQGMYDLYLKVEKTFDDYYKRVETNIKNNIKSLMENIGPHEGKELELMLNGSKPAALISNKDLSKFKPYIEKKQLIRVGTVRGFANSIVNIITLPKQEWRGRQLIKIFNTITKMDGFPYSYESIKYHIKIGLLLGYTKEDIKHFINRNFRKYNESI